MNYVYSLQKNLFTAIGTEAVMIVCMIVGLLATAVVLWSAKPGMAQRQQIANMGAVVFFGLTVALLDASPVNSAWTKYAAAVITPLVVWGLGRECWTGYLTPWTVPWRRIWLLILVIWAMSYLTIKAIPHELKELIWAPYFLTLLLSPLFAFQGLMWWIVLTLKRVYMGKFAYEKESTKTVDVYFTAWWNDKVRGREINQANWLEVTKKHPQFMASRWWQKKGVGFWPDMMEWDAKLGTVAMLWFIQQRMDSPPEVLDDYSDAKGIFSFSDGARIALAP